MDPLLSFYAGMGIMAATFGTMRFVGWLVAREAAEADLRLHVEELKRRLDRLEGRKP